MKKTKRKKDFMTSRNIVSASFFQHDYRYLKPLMQYYLAGGFDGKDLPPRVLNALDSLSSYYWDWNRP